MIEGVATQELIDALREQRPEWRPHVYVVTVAGQELLVVEFDRLLLPAEVQRAKGLAEQVVRDLLQAPEVPILILHSMGEGPCRCSCGSKRV